MQVEAGCVEVFELGSGFDKDVPAQLFQDFQVADTHDKLLSRRLAVHHRHCPTSVIFELRGRGAFWVKQQG